VQDYETVARDPQVAHMNALLTVPGSGPAGADVTLVNHPLRYDGEGAEVRRPPQRIGAQTGEILAELGFSADETATLAADGVVRLPDDGPAGGTHHRNGTNA
jgi:crotonobetainyl-CoA:carnitine CoA-transferase CaiB-like acyl-CoA transferase